MNHAAAEHKKKPGDKTDQADTVTATVAASVAVAATAPFLKACLLVSFFLLFYFVVKYYRYGLFV